MGTKALLTHTKTTLIVLVLLASLLVPVLGSSSANAEMEEFGYGWTNVTSLEWPDSPDGIATDSDENVYLVGTFNVTRDFDPGAGTDSKTSAGASDIFLTKFNADGTYGYTKVFGGIGYESAFSLTIDVADNIYLSGTFTGTADFDPGAGTDNKTTSGGTNAFVTKFNADGTYAYTKTMGGTGYTRAGSVTTDPDNNVYAAGLFDGTADFDPGAGTDNKTTAGNNDIFLTKINADGTYAYTKTMGSTGRDQPYSVVTDLNGNVFMAGYFRGTVDFDPGAGTDNKTSAGSSDIFLAKINADGTYAYTKTMGGTGSDDAQTVTVDQTGNVYLTGYFNSASADFDPGAGTDNKASAGGYDIFLTKINTDGTYGYTKTMGGAQNDDYGYGIDTDQDDNVYISGYFESTTADFDPGVDVDSHTTYTNTNEIFLTRINADGSYGYTKTLDNTDGNAFSLNYYGNLVTVDKSNDIYLSGSFGGVVDFDPTASTDNKDSGNDEFAFLTKLTQTTYQQITNLDPSLAAKTLSNTDATDNTIENGTSATIRLSLSDTTPIADVTTTFTTDLNWSTVTADSNLTTGTAFAHNLTAADGTAGTFTLYVPKLPNHTRVGICPGANSIASTTNQCEGLYYLTENTDNNLTTTTIDTQDYWTITGLTGTGGFSAEAVATTTADTAGQDTLAETGQNTTSLILLATILLVLAAATYRRKELL